MFKKHSFYFLSIFIIPFLSIADVTSGSNAITTEKATELVKKMLDENEVDTSKHFCVKGTMTCRSFYTLKNKITKAPAPFYYDTFYSADRQVGSTTYFIPVPDSKEGHYYQLSDMEFNGKTEINFVASAEVFVSGSKTNKVFSNLLMLKLGTSFYKIASMTYAEDHAFIEGNLQDKNDPSYSKYEFTEYFRIVP